MRVGVEACLQMRFRPLRALLYVMAGGGRTHVDDDDDDDVQGRVDGSSSSHTRGPHGDSRSHGITVYISMTRNRTHKKLWVETYHACFSSPEFSKRELPHFSCKQGNKSSNFVKSETIAD